MLNVIKDYILQNKELVFATYNTSYDRQEIEIDGNKLILDKDKLSDALYIEFKNAQTTLPGIPKGYFSSTDDGTLLVTDIYFKDFLRQIMQEFREKYVQNKLKEAFNGIIKSTLIQKELSDNNEE